MRNLDQLTGALRQYLPGGDAITAIRALTTGFSNETYLIEGADLILRLPPAAGAMLKATMLSGRAGFIRNWPVRRLRRRSRRLSRSARTPPLSAFRFS